MSSKKIKNNDHTIRRLLKYLTGTYKLQFFVVVISIIISSLAGVAGILFLKYLIDDFIVPLLGSQNPNYSSLFNAVLLMGGIYLIGIICTYIYNRLMINISQGILNRIRKEMFEHMQTLRIGYFDSHPHGETMSTYTNDVDTLRQCLSQSIPQIFAALISVISIFISMLATNVYLTIIVLVMVGIMLVVTKILGNKSSKQFVLQQQNIGKVNGYIEEMIDGQKVVKVFCYEEKSKENFDKLNEMLCDSTTKANTYANVLMPCIMNIGNLGYVLIAVFGGIFAINGVLTIGAIASFLQFIKAFTNPIGQISQQMNSIVMALAGAKRIFKLIDEKSEEDNGYVTLVNAKEENGKIIEVEERTGMWAWKHPHHDGRVTYTKLNGNVEFENVKFVSFVGATGAGKTTITNLINRFYDISYGKIRYDGINIKKIKKADLRRSLGMVLQDTHLFTGTIMENIRYGKLNATDEEVYEAARLSNADKFIKHLPNGYNTVITGDGEGLSQGQRQLLSIARAALDNAPVLILDEATSSIDTRTEKIVQEGMDKLMKGRTVFVIAHRLSTIRNSDLIMVLDHGNIIERGKHEELLKNKGTYYQLYTGILELD